MTWQPWQTAWQEALYGDRGFYRQPLAPARHFATSAQGIPGVDRLLAAAVAKLAAAHGATHIVDLAAGGGELLNNLHDLDPSVLLTGVDIVSKPKTVAAQINWVLSPGGRALPDSLDHLTDVLVIAHEWLDVVPCPIAEWDGEHLRIVEVRPDGWEQLGAPVTGTDLQWCQANWPGPYIVDERLEIGRARDTAYGDLVSRVDRGVVVAVDYGHLAGHRRGTFVGYRNGAICLPKADGSTDLTAHVAMDTLGAQRLVQQRDLFAELGFTATMPAQSLAASDPPAYLAALAARSAYAEATRRGGLGDFWWAITVLDPTDEPDTPRR